MVKKSALIHTNQLQVRYLSERIKSKERDARNEIYNREKNRKEPPVIRQARAMVKKWDASEYTFKRSVQDRALQKLNSAVLRAREKLLFSTPSEALKAVQELEQLVITV